MFTPVTAPPLEPPAISLLRSARNPTDPAGVRWQDGFTYLAEGDNPLGYTTICPTGSRAVTGLPATPDVVEWTPYVVWGGFRCSAFGWEDMDWRGRVQRALDAGTTKAVEHEFWTGELAAAQGWGNLALASDHADDITPGSPPSMKRALGMLEQSLADCGLGAQGVIHMRVEALPHFTTVRKDGNVLRTARDTIVVPGVGYTDLGPDGDPAADGTTWMYATGLVDVRLDSAITYTPDDPNDSEGIKRAWDRSTNLITLRGFKTAIASWDGTCHFAIRATLET